MNMQSAVINERDFDRINELVHSPRLRITHATMVAALERGLGRGRVVPPTRVPRGVITMNSKVQFRDLGTGERESYTLVYPAEAEIEQAKLSVLAPLGAALLGAKVGATVECLAPGGVRKLKVEKILYQPEAAGDFHL